MYGLSASFVGNILRRQTLEKRSSDFLDPFGPGDFLARALGDVKNIRHLIDIGRDLSDMDRQSQLMQVMSDGKQHADPVIGKNLDDRKIVR